MVTGHLVLSFRNDINPLIPPIIGNESGTESFSPGLFDTGNGTVTDNGPTSLILGPHSQTNLASAGEPEPGLVFFNGHLVLTITDGVVSGLTFSGSQVDGCALLAG